MSYNGDDALIRRSSFKSKRPTSNANETSDLRLPVRLVHTGDLALSPSFQYRTLYDRDTQHSQCPSPRFLVSGASQHSAMCISDTMPSLASYGLPAMVDLNNESGSSDKGLHDSAASSSIAVPLPEVRVEKARSASAEFARTITTQVMDQPANPSLQPDREAACHDLEQQQSKDKCIHPSTASSSAGKEQKFKKGKPKRALTAYNLFFKEQRQLILDDCRSPQVPFHSNGSKLGKRMRNSRENSSTGIGFAEMGKIIGQRWQELDRDLRRRYEARAEAEKRRYQEELAQYLVNERNEREVKFASLQASVSEDTKHRYFSTGK